MDARSRRIRRVVMIANRPRGGGFKSANPFGSNDDSTLISTNHGTMLAESSFSTMCNKGSASPES